MSGVDVADGRKPRAVKHPGGVVGEQADLAVDVRAVDNKLQRCGVGVELRMCASSCSGVAVESPRRSARATTSSASLARCAMSLVPAGIRRRRK